jgi:hypothetical protein
MRRANRWSKKSSQPFVLQQEGNPPNLVDCRIGPLADREGMSGYDGAAWAA